MQADLNLDWDDLRGLSPEEQTRWLSARMPDWDRFVADVQQSDAQLEAHRAAGNEGPPPGSISLEDYRRQRALALG